MPHPAILQKGKRPNPARAYAGALDQQAAE
jgi:hypothetical protein